MNFLSVSLFQVRPPRGAGIPSNSNLPATALSVILSTPTILKRYRRCARSAVSLVRSSRRRRAGIKMNTMCSVGRGERVRAATGRRVARVFGLHPKELGRPATS